MIRAPVSELELFVTCTCHHCQLQVPWRGNCKFPGEELDSSPFPSPGSSPLAPLLLLCQGGEYKRAATSSKSLLEGGWPRLPPMQYRVPWGHLRRLHGTLKRAATSSKSLLEGGWPCLLKRAATSSKSLLEGGWPCLFRVP